ncbi:MAG: (d)CMP kinase, partial [Firmicutes bacterium]|nr:(d)CMP kinase [Bacillota bacterium]
ELEKLGAEYDFEDIKQQIIARDYNDMNREHNPLRKAEDAVELDTTELNIEEVCTEIEKIIKQKTM